MIPMRSSKILVLTKTSLCVALLCVSAFIVIPIPFTPIMITAQTLVVTLIALLLKPSQSAAAVGVYLLLGICGIPVFPVELLESDSCWVLPGDSFGVFWPPPL